MRSTRRPLTGPFAWKGAELDRDERWIHPLSPAGIGEIEAAVARVTSLGLDWRTLRREDFPLPKLGRTLEGIRQALENGRGIALLRGVPVGGLSDSATRIAFAGLGAHVGRPVYQNARGELMREIRDEGEDRGARYGEVRVGNGAFLSSRARVASSGELRFHTDRSDVVALLCVRPAKAGGLSRIASSVAVHNALLERRPDLLECLFRPWPRSRFGEEAADNSDFYLLPVMGVRDEKFTSHYSRTYIEAAQLIDSAPRLDDDQREAMDALAATAEELCLQITFEPGDLQFLNSHVTYHSRTAYEDHADASKKRLLYRLWLCPPDNRALPDDHAVLWGDVRAGAYRGGIRQPATSAP